MTVSVAGSFHYYVASGADPAPLCDGYLSVDPELPRGLPLDSLVCQTVLAKLLGPLASWRDKLEVAYRWVPCHVSHVTSYKALLQVWLQHAPLHPDTEAGGLQLRLLSG